MISWASFPCQLRVRGEDAYNAFIQPLIDEYGYIEDGVKTGGGNVGGGSEINNQDYSRQSFEIGYDYVFETQNTTHEFHYRLSHGKNSGRPAQVV